MKQNDTFTVRVSAGIVLLGLVTISLFAKDAAVSPTNEATNPTTAPAVTPEIAAASKLPVPENLTKLQRVLIVGNSLTRHGPSTEALGWPYDWGMAATALESDYAHQLFQRICAAHQADAAKPELKIDSMLAFAIETRQSFLDYKPDFVVLQMGDNLRGPQANEKDFVQPYVTLIEALKKANPDVIVVTVGLWSNDGRNDLVKKVAKETGAIFVTLNALSADPANYAKAEGHFTHDGVNWHPGNRGMAKIAEQIWATTILSLSPAAETSKRDL